MLFPQVCCCVRHCRNVLFSLRKCIIPYSLCRNFRSNNYILRVILWKNRTRRRRSSYDRSLLSYPHDGCNSTPQSSTQSISEPQRKETLQKACNVTLPVGTKRSVSVYYSAAGMGGFLPLVRLPWLLKPLFCCRLIP